MANEQNNKDDKLMDAIGNAMEGIGNSYSSLYTTLATALEKNMQMSEQFNKIMEQTYLANIKVGTELKRTSNGVIDILLTIQNATPFPIVSMTGDLEMDKEKISASFNDSVFEAPCNFEPHSKTTQLIHLTMAQGRPIFGKGTISLSFPHPINGSTIGLSHTFGIYVIDQLSRKTVSKSEENKFTKKMYGVQFLREILEIHASKGLDAFICIELSCTNFKLVCEITRFSDDLEMAEIEFSGDPADNELVSRVIEEFDALHDVK